MLPSFIRLLFIYSHWSLFGSEAWFQTLQYAKYLLWHLDRSDVLAMTETFVFLEILESPATGIT